jgi:hypothetical protein
MIARVLLSVGAAVLWSTAVAELPRVETQPDKALVWVIRTAGSTWPFYFFVDGEFVGVNRANEHFYAFVEPGRHLLWSCLADVDALELDVEAGRAYFVLQKPKYAPFRSIPRVRLEVVDRERAERFLTDHDTHLSEPSPKDRREGEKLAGEHIEDAGRKAAAALER